MKAEVSTTKRLVSAVAVMGSGTLISRILGLVRLMLLAYLLGNGTRKADIFTLANLIPNSLLLLFAGGVLNTVLVPQIVRAIKNDDDGGEAYTNRIITAFALLIGGMTLVLTIAAPVLTWIYSSGWHTPELAAHYQTMVMLTYLCVPQLFFYGMFFLLGQVLNAKDHFGPMLWAPIANNVISILVLGLYFVVWGLGDNSTAFTTGQVLVLGIGSTLGIVVQLLVLLPFMKRTEFKFRPRFDLKGAGLGHTFHLAKWTLGYVLVNQLVLILVYRLSSAATTGAEGSGAGTTVYANAEMLWLLPHSLITVSLTTAMLSSASRLAADNNLAGVAQETLKTVKFAAVLLVPASVGLIALAYPAARLLFGHGSGAASAPLVAITLMAFSIGLVPYTIQFITTRTFYALENTRAAFFLQLLIATINATLALVLVLPWNQPNWVAPGLALAVTGAYLVGVYVSVRALKRRLPDLDAAEMLRFVVRLFIVAVPAGVATFFTARAVINSMGGVLGDLLGSLAGVAVFLVLFLLGARLLHLHEVTDAVRSVLRRGRAAEPADNATGEPQLSDLEQEAAELGVSEPSLDSSQPLGIAEESSNIPASSSLGDEDADTMSPIVESGQLLSHRYSLKDRLMRRGDTETWLAFDQVLSRLVLVHLLPTETPRLHAVLDAARKGAVATEARFLRVLDAVESTDSGDSIGGYIVCEYAPGQSLERLLHSGPLSAIEAGWIVRELADALSTMHAQGLFHERLSPDTVIISASGNVKIVGFGVESAIEGEDEPRSWANREASDVRALGKLLYACLVQRWPGGDKWGLRAAPKDAHGEYLTPRQVRAGVSPILDGICDQILSSRPRRGEPPLRTTGDIVAELNRVLGTADASGDLEHRLRYPTVADRQEPVVPDAVSTQALPVVMVPTDEADLPPEPLTIKPPVLVATAEPQKPRRWLLVLIGIVLTTLLVSLAAIALRDAGKAAAPTSPPQQATPAAEAVHKIVKGYDFDPDGDKAENPKLVPLAFDGKPETFWKTENYGRSPKLGNLKPGVGIVVDLGEDKQVSAVKLTLSGTPTAIEARIPKAAGAPEKSTDWQAIASAPKAGTAVELRAESPVTTRYVLLWITSLPEVSKGRYEARINEVQVLG